MRKASNPVLTSDEFIEDLVANKGSLTNKQMAVSGNVHIKSRKIGLDCLTIENVTFTGQVSIEDFTSKGFALYIGMTNFTQGLTVENNAIRWISMSDVTAEWINLWRCRADTVVFQEVRVSKGLDLSGLKLSGLTAESRLAIRKCEYGELELIHTSTSETIVVPKVVTDDLVAAFQFRMIGVPVFMSTGAVRGLMEKLKEKDPKNYNVIP